MSLSPNDRDLDRNPVNLQPLTPLTFLERSVAVFPDRLAIAHEIVRRSYSEFHARTKKLASALAKRGFARGDIRRCDMLTAIHDRDQGIKNFTPRPLLSAHRSHDLSVHKTVRMAGPCRTTGAPAKQIVASCSYDLAAPNLMSKPVLRSCGTSRIIRPDAQNLENSDWLPVSAGWRGRLRRSVWLLEFSPPKGCERSMDRRTERSQRT